MKSEVLTRQKSHLDLKPGWLRLEPGETKNDEGHERIDQRLCSLGARITREPGA